MIELARGISGFPVKPEGSNRVRENLSHSSRSGTPCCSASEIAVAKLSIRPEMVEPSLAMLDEDLARLAGLVQADVDVALVAGDRELVGERLPLVGQLPAAPPPADRS